MRFASLRFLVAVWYFCTVAVIASLLAGGNWFAMWLSLDHALDQHLRYRLIGMHHFLEESDTSANGQIEERLREISTLGELWQVFDGSGRLIAQSEGLARHHVTDQPPSDLGFEIRYNTRGSRGFPVRLASQRVAIGGRQFIIVVADPQKKFEGALREFTSFLLFSLPLALVLATLCGFWFSRRALAPVDRITEDARAITAHNLSARLAVPRSGDEMQRLSETLNQMLDRINESFTRMRQFTADASHELRAPLTLIYMAAEYSLRRERSREELVENMQKVYREAKRTKALVDDLLLLARGDAGRNGTELRRMNVCPLLRDIADKATRLAAAKEIGLDLRLPDEALYAKADEQSLDRLLLILVDNAIKYTAARGKITLEARNEGRAVVIAVADNGSGIAPEDLPHVFERFWRADKVRSREEGGTGLGLTIAKQIADQHGASLTVQSEVGCGSVFSVRLPEASG
jgi:heavy metal sensor kinase